MKTFTETADKYRADVLAGKVLACKWVRLACERQTRDLARAATEGFHYRFDTAAANKVCHFIEFLPHIKGPLSGKRIELAPWQVFILTTVFGWLHTETGKRRFRRVYIEVPRGNGKSAFSSPVCIYMLAADKEGGPEVYSAARTKEQARIVFDVAKKMLQSEEGAKLRKHYGIQVLTHSITHPASNGIFRPLASEAESLDGLNVHFGCLDELHAHPNADIHDVLDTATGKRDQSMLWMITTAGTDKTGICYSTRDYVLKILESVFTDESYFGIVYTIDEDEGNKDFWSTPEAARMANPNFGVSVYADDLEQKCRKALQQVTAQTNYKTKHLDMWENVGSAWMDMRRFGKCADPKLNEDDFKGSRCVLGLDLASKMDLLSLVKVYWKWADRKRHYYAFWKHWIPELRVEATPILAIKQWVGEGRIQTCPGETNDFDEVKECIRAACKENDVPEVAHDQWGALEMVNELTDEGITMFEVAQVTKNLSPAMREIEAAIYDGRFHFTGDPVASWAMSNVIAREDKKGNIFPFKLKPENKIDPIAALLTAAIRVMTIDSTAPEGGDVSVFGQCSKCAEICIGTLVDGKAVFVCSKHKMGA